MQLEVDYRPGTSLFLKHGVVGLMGGIFNSGEDVFPFEKGVVGKDLLKGSTGRQEFQNVRDANTLSAYARATPALPFLDGDALKSIWVHKSATSIPRGDRRDGRDEGPGLPCPPR